MRFCNQPGCRLILNHGGECSAKKQEPARGSTLSDRDLVAASGRAVADFRRGHASPWRLVTLLEECARRIEEKAQ